MMKKQTFKRIVKTTRNNIVRNKWLSTASIVVISLTFTIATTLIGMVIVSSRTVSVFEKKAQVMIFFHSDTDEEDMIEMQEELQKNDIFERVDYISLEEALEIYKGYYPEQADTATVDYVEPSLDLRAKDVDDVPEVIDIANDLKAENEIIEDVWYFEDVIESLKAISRIIKIGGTILVVALSTISVVLILITIGFNINAHQKEIEVMQLIGSTHRYIKIPFLLEGTFYGLIGSAVSITFLLTLWYGSIMLMRDNDLYHYMSQIFFDIGMPYLKEFNPLFILGIIGFEVLIGSVTGLISSSVAIVKYLK